MTIIHHLHRITHPQPPIPSPPPPTPNPQPPSFPPEVRLLLDCARTELSEERRQRVTELLRQPVDWAALAGLAERHGLIPLLYRHLETLDPTAIPKPIFARLWSQSQATAGRNVMLTQELLRLLALLQANGIPAIPFKGPALAALVYGDISLRQFTDLDILVEQQQARRAKALLEAHGYDYPDRLTEAQETAYLRSANHHHFQLARVDDRVAVELHWQPASRRFFPAGPVDQIWQRLEPLPLLGATVNGLAAEDLLLLLSMHGAKHGWAALEWLVGLAELLRVKPALDWPETLARAGRWHCTRMLLLGLHLAQVVLETPLPDVVRVEIERRPTLAPLAGRICTELFQTEAPAGRIDSRLDCLRLQLSAQDRWRDRLRYGLSLVTAPTVIEWRELPLPPALFFLYPLLRPFRLAAKYTIKAIDH